MKKWTNRIAFLWVILLLPGAVAMGGADDCCRPLSKQVWYLNRPMDSIPAYEAEVLKVSRENGRIALFVHTSRRAPARTFGGSDYHFVRSLDMGKTLQPIPQDVPSPLGAIDSSFLEAPSNSNFLYRYVRELGVYLRSEDGGLSWMLPKHLLAGEPRDRFAYKVARTNMNTVRFNIIAVHPLNPLTIFASLTVAPWTAITFYDPNFMHPEQGVAKELEDIYVSHDGGDTWEKFTSGLRSGEPIGISPSQPRVIYGHGRRGIVKSADGGITWQPVGQQRELELRPLTEADKNEETRLLKGLVHLHLRQILVDPSNENIVYLVSNKGLIRSNDGGSTWCLLNLGFDEIDSVNSVALNPAQSMEMFVGTSRGIFRSSDGGCHFWRIYPQAN